ncbi:hypothetical protein [Halomonas sp. CKK8]|uniref:hypothetical protein n=1 Tax=Halomonas sp. CKK8 TaxID=3036127 RepID=UPI0024150876|nr:hypothetical protein [Halomonas sp. CKK8]WFM71826.1 hypothetical protein P8934_02215 [Halomonas sp. CKK8]
MADDTYQAAVEEAKQMVPLFMRAATSQDHEAFTLRLYRQWADPQGRPDQRVALVRQAEKGSRIAQQAINERLDACLEQGRKAPDEFVEYSRRVRKSGLRTRRGRPPSNHSFKRKAIATMVDHLCQKFGLPASRNDANIHHSACDAVADALKLSSDSMGYDSVKKIYFQVTTFPKEFR